MTVIVALFGFLLGLAAAAPWKRRRRQEDAAPSAAIADALRESEARYRLLAEHSTDMIFRLDLDFVRRYVSPASRHILGYAPEELVGHKPVNQIHPEDQERVAATYQAVASGLERASVVNRIRHRDGRWLWVEAKLQLVRDGAGRPAELIGSLSDISARREAELALQESEEKYRSLYVNSPAMMYSVDAAGRLLSVSDQWLATLGYARDAVMGRRAVEFMTPDSGRWIDEIARPALAEAGTGSEIPVQFVREDGAVRDAMLSVISERDTGGEISRAFVVAVDVTEHKRAEAALRASEAVYRPVVDNASDLIVRLGRDGRRKYISPSYTRILGYQPSEVMGDVLGSISLPEDRALIVDACQQMFERNEGGSFIGRGIRKDGQIIWLEANCSVMTDPATGRAEELIIYLRDVTERQLAAERLEQARQEAEFANRAKSDFLASMSHEIRTPMNGVLGFAAMLLATDLSADQRRIVGLLKGAGDSLLAIINDILDLSKIETGALELETIPLSLREVAEGTVAMVEPEALAKDLTLRIDIAADLPGWVLGDPTRLRQILLNFLSNAVKFTPSGGTALRIRRDPAGTRDGLIFEVADTGIGIPFDRQHLLFQPFSQLDRSTTRKFGGTGLGLVISRKLVEAMPEGRIGVESAEGQGSRFWFAVALPPTAQPSPGIADSMVTRGPPAHVLVAEDMVVNQLVVEGILSNAGHIVDLVSDGQAAVRAVQERHYDLVLMDIQMPVMDGVDAARSIRALAPPTGAIPIIALSANALASEVDRCLAAGMNAHVAKPIHEGTLLRTIDQWRQRGGTGRE